MRLDARVADKAERIARRAATRIMVDDHVHRRHAPCGRRFAAPSVWPISRRRAPILVAVTDTEERRTHQNDAAGAQFSPQAIFGDVRFKLILTGKRGLLADFAVGF
jgi:hypothetical protein